MKIVIFTLADNKPKIKKAGVNIDVVSWKSKKIDLINIRDYDGVIFDVSSLFQTDEELELWDFESRVLSADATNDVLRSKDTFIAVIGDPSTKVSSSSIVENLGFNLERVNGGGSSLVKAKDISNNGYVKYLDRIKKYEYSFKESGATITSEMSDVCGTAQSSLRSHVAFNGLLMNRAGHIVAGSLILLTYTEDYNGNADNVTRFMEGRFILMPVLPSGSRESIESVLDIMVESSTGDAPVPEWVDDISVFGQEKLDAEIVKHRQKINELTIKVDGLVSQRDDIRSSLDILYKSDKPLEKAVKEYLGRLGVTVEEPAVENKAEFYMTHGNRKFVTEVKSTKNKDFDQKGLRQVNDWRDDIFAETGVEHKPVLITSNQYNTEPSQRNDDFLDINLINYAKKRGIAVISVKVLFETLQLVEKGIVKLDDFMKMLDETSGIVSPVQGGGVDEQKSADKK